MLVVSSREEVRETRHKQVHRKDDEEDAGDLVKTLVGHYTPNSGRFLGPRTLSGAWGGGLYLFRLLRLGLFEFVPGQWVSRVFRKKQKYWRGIAPQELKGAIMNTSGLMALSMPRGFDVFLHRFSGRYVFMCTFAVHFLNTMAKKGNRVQVILECTEHKESGKPGTSRYITTKNRKNTPDRIEVKKYNPILKKMTVHKEIK